MATMKLFALLFVTLLYNVTALPECDPSAVEACQEKVDIMKEFIMDCSIDPIFDDPTVAWDELDCDIFDPPPCCPDDPDFVCHKGEKVDRTHVHNVRATTIKGKARDYKELLGRDAPPIPSDATFQIEMTFRIDPDRSDVNLQSSPSVVRQSSPGVIRQPGGDARLSDSDSEDQPPQPMSRRLNTEHISSIEEGIKNFIGVPDAIVTVTSRDRTHTQDPMVAEISIKLHEKSKLTDLMDTNVYLYDLSRGEEDITIPGIVVEGVDRKIEEENGGIPAPGPGGPQSQSHNGIGGLAPETSMALFIVFGVVAGIIIGAALMFAIKSKSKNVPTGKALETTGTFNVRNPMAAKAVSAKSAPDHVHVPRRVPRPNTTEHAQRIAFATMQRSNSRRPSRHTPRV